MNKKPHPLEEGCLKQIYEIFVKPFLIYKPELMNQKEWQEQCWNTRDVDIIRYKALHAFKLPGLYLEAPLRKVQGLGYRKVLSGNILEMRKDINQTTCDVEFHGGDKEQVFELTDDEWNRIMPLLKEMPWKGDLL